MCERGASVLQALHDEAVLKPRGARIGRPLRGDAVPKGLPQGIPPVATPRTCIKGRARPTGQPRSGARRGRACNSGSRGRG